MYVISSVLMCFMYWSVACTLSHTISKANESKAKEVQAICLTSNSNLQERKFTSNSVLYSNEHLFQLTLLFQDDLTLFSTISAVPEQPLPSPVAAEPVASSLLVSTNAENKSLVLNSSQDTQEIAEPKAVEHRIGLKLLSIIVYLLWNTSYDSDLLFCV